MAVKCTKVNVSGVIASGCSVLGVHIKAGTSDGTVDIKQVDANGSADIEIEVTANGGDQYVPIPGGGIPYGANCYADISNIDAVTVFYEDY